MRKLLILLAALLAALLPTAFAQGVTQERVTTQDLLRLFDNAVAIEVAIPQGATVYTLDFGTIKESASYSTFLPETVGGQSTARLRVVTLLPEPSDAVTCAADGVEAMVIVSVTNHGGLDDHIKEKVCVTHPSPADWMGSVHRVLYEGVPELDRWTPILFYSSLIATSREGDSRHSAIDIDNVFWVQVGFLAGNRTDFPSHPPLGIEELIALPDVSRLVEEYGLPAR